MHQITIAIWRLLLLIENSYFYSDRYRIINKILVIIDHKDYIMNDFISFQYRFIYFNVIKWNNDNYSHLDSMY